MSLDRSLQLPGGWKRNTLFSAISASLAASYGGAVTAQEQSGDAPQSGALEEVIVTARKREENIQDIPQSIQAFSQVEIEKVGIKDLQDVAKFVPALTVVGERSGFQKIVFRGLADSVRPFIADSSAAIYLDEQPLTTGAQSPEIPAIDLERIETLAGPQGTLYGASSQSGTIRYITAKPDVTGFSANVGGGLHSIDHGGTGWDADATVNIPLVQDVFAIRLVGFGRDDAGFIDNVFSNTPGRIENLYTPEEVYVPGSKNNAAYVEDDYNSADWYGGRISARWVMNDTWMLTGIYNYTNADIKGYNNYDPTTGDLKTIKYHEEYWHDEWSNFQLTLDGDLGIGQLTSTLAYFERDTAYQFDSTTAAAYYHSILGYYGRGTCGSNPYYAAYNIYDFSTACALNGVGYDVDDGDPTALWKNDQRDTRWTLETRLSGSTSRWDWTAGFFYQEADQHWDYGTYIDDLDRTEAWAAFEALYGPLPPTDIRWASAERNSREDIAVFGEATWNLTEQWKILLGARWYDTTIDRTYTQATPQGSPISTSTPHGDDSGVLPKFGFQYFFEDDRMFYALYSEGFRTGGINRARGTPTLPIPYESDLLENYEAGFKSRWMDGKMQFNLITYHQVWKDMQLELTDPSYYCCNQPYQTVIANLGDATVDGFDLEFNYLISGNWSLGVVATYLFNAEIDNEIQVYDDRDPEQVALFVAAGTRLPLTADLNWSAFLEFDHPVNWGGGSVFARLQSSYSDGSYNLLVDNDFDDLATGYGGRDKTPSYTLWDLRTGWTNANWELMAYIDNFTDERAVTYHDTNADLFWGRDNLRILQPRTYGVSLRRYFR